MSRTLQRGLTKFHKRAKMGTRDRLSQKNPGSAPGFHTGGSGGGLGFYGGSAGLA